MHQYFGDIIEKLGEPLWWDEHAVPRYCEFSPDRLADIYAKECVLMLIACQNCGHRFKVAMSNHGYDRHYEPFSFLKNDIYKNLGFGDPPNNGCCGAGSSMTSDSIAILEFWVNDVNTMYNWVRKPEYEVLLDME
jgi:hypothetical protein